MRHGTMLAAIAFMALVGTGAPALAHDGGRDHDRDRFHERFERGRFHQRFDHGRFDHGRFARVDDHHRGWRGRFDRDEYTYGGRSCHRSGFRWGRW